MLSASHQHLLDFCNKNSKVFEYLLEIQKADMIYKEIGFTPKKGDLSSKLINDPPLLFKTLICIGYPRFEQPIDFSSLEFIIDSEYKFIILEFFCKINSNLPELLKDAIKIQLENELKNCEWQRLINDDVFHWDFNNPTYQFLSLLITFSIKYCPLIKQDLIISPIFESFLLWLIKDESDQLQVELYLIIMNILADDGILLWMDNKNKLIHSVISKIASRQALENLMEILIKHNYTAANETDFDNNFIRKLWDFAFGIKDEHGIEVLLKLCLKSSTFTVCCFNSFIGYFLDDQEVYANKIMGALTLYHKLLIILDSSTFTDAPQFYRIVSNLYNLKHSIKLQVIEFVDEQLNSQIYLKDFLECYFELISNHVKNESKIETHIKQFIIYTLIDNSQEQSRREDTFKTYLNNVVKFLKKKIIDCKEAVKYDGLIKKVYKYVPNMYSFILELAKKEENIIAKNHANARSNLFCLLLSMYDIPEDISMSSIIPLEIQQIIDSIINYLCNSENAEHKSTLNENLIHFYDEEMENYKYESLKYEDFIIPGKLEYWIKVVLLKKGIPYLLNTALSSEDAKFIKSALKKVKGSFAFKIIFNQNIPIPIRLYFTSHFNEIISMTIKHGAHDNIINKANKNAVQMIGKSCEPIEDSLKRLFLSIVKSCVAVEAFDDYGCDLKKAIGIENRTFYTNLPLNIYGMAVLGDVILLNSEIKQSFEFYKCTKIIAYLKGVADILKKRNDTLNETATIEGELQLESILFGNFVNKFNDAQIKFIIERSNWEMTLRSFKSYLEELNSSSSDYYHFSNSQYYAINRAPHINTSFWKN